MSEPSFASLNPSLLARKGGAKPAMRPQAGHAVPNAGADLEDLGWNDMGSEEKQADEAIQPAPKAKPEVQDAAAVSAPPAPSPALQQQAEIAARIESEPAPAPKKTKPVKTRKPAKRSALKQGRRAAFTLRLDAERHLKLRLAATIKGVSAQNFVTEALDAQLATIDDLETLTAKIKRD